MDKQERAEALSRRITKKSNVKRETQVLKAIINQTRSIGNEFLVINIKADTEAGWRIRAVCGQGCTWPLLACRTKNFQHQRKEKRHYNPGPPGMKMKIEQTTARTKRNHTELIFLFYLFISWPAAAAAAAVARPLLLKPTRKQQQKTNGLNFTPNSHRSRPECNPAIKFSRASVTPLRLTASRPPPWRWRLDRGGRSGFLFSWKFILIAKNAGFWKVTNRASCTKGLPESQHKV